MNLVVKVVGEGALASPFANGRLIPVLIVDASSRPEIVELIRVHEHLPPGDVISQWGSVQGQKDQVMLALDFSRPIETTIVILFSIESQGILVDSMLESKAVYLQTGEAGDRVSSTMDKPRLVVELPDTGFRPKWDSLQLERMTEVVMKRSGLRKGEAEDAAREMIAEWRKLTTLRIRSK